MRTYRISEEEIKGLKPVAVGYKIFKNDWTSKYGDYDYKDENGNVVGTIHKVDGDIKECEWGLHFSIKPQDCFNFYECVQWNKFAKVEAYDKCLSKDKKCVTNILKIVEIYTFDEFIRLIQNNLQSDGVSYSYGIHDSNGVNASYGIHASYGINDSKGVSYSNGINASYGVFKSFGICKCNGISQSIFCYNKSGKLMAFNKKITEERFYEIYKKLLSFNWYPSFNNAEKLKSNLRWCETNIPAIRGVENKTAWSFMPEEMKEYIKSLTEYNEEIFNKIIGLGE